jgi:FkbM family methyltransferase
MQEIDFHRAMARPGTIVDAGAHEGRLSVKLAELPDTHVIAFEPLPPAFRRLQAAAANRCGRIAPRPEALSDRAGIATLSVPRVGGVAQDEWGSIVKDYEAISRDDPRVDAIDTWTVPAIPLDALGLTDLTAIKIDVEGAEEGGLARCPRHAPALPPRTVDRDRRTAPARQHRFDPSSVGRPRVSRIFRILRRLASDRDAGCGHDAEGIPVSRRFRGVPSLRILLLFRG